MTDVHYDLRASERGAAKSRLKDIISIGAPVEKRKAFWKKREKDVKCFLFYGQVHILSADLKKRITVVPYSHRKWKYVKYDRLNEYKRQL